MQISKLNILHTRLLPFLLLIFTLHLCSEQQSRSSSQAGDEQIQDLLEESHQAFEAKNYQYALHLLDSLEQTVPENPDVQFLKGLIFNNLNRLDDARASYEKVLHLDPDYEGVRFNLGNIAMSRGNFEQAIEYYRQEHVRHPAPNNLVNIGLAYANLHQPDSSMKAYERAIALDSAFADAFVLLGQEYKNSGEPEKAIALTKQGLERAPDNATYLSILGGILLQNGKPAEALPYLEKAAAIRPWGYRPVYNLGLALQQVGRQTESGRYLAKADTLRRLQSQVAHLQMQVQNTPQNFMRWVELGEVLRDMGNYGAALDALRSASLIEPNHLALRNNIAYLSMALGDTSEAVEIFQSIVAQDSAQTDVWYNLGVVFAETGQNAEARNAWEQVLEQTPQDTTAQRYLRQLSDS